MVALLRVLWKRVSELYQLRAPEWRRGRRADIGNNWVDRLAKMGADPLGSLGCGLNGIHDRGTSTWGMIIPNASHDRLKKLKNHFRNRYRFYTKSSTAF